MITEEVFALNSHGLSVAERRDIRAEITRFQRNVAERNIAELKAESYPLWNAFQRSRHLPGCLRPAPTSPLCYLCAEQYEMEARPSVSSSKRQSVDLTKPQIVYSQRLPAEEDSDVG